LLRAVMRAHRVAPDAFTRHELARILPEIATLAATSAGQQATLWLAMENLLSDAVNAGLGALAIDDLQFADEASIEALRWLTSSRALAGLRFGLATRPLQRPTLKTLFDDWLVDSQRPEPIDLAPLSRPEVGSLIESLCVRELDAARLA